MYFCHILMEIYLNVGHVEFLANVIMLKFGSELRYGIPSPNVRTPVDIPNLYTWICFGYNTDHCWTPNSHFRLTPGPLYNTVHYSTVDHCRIPTGLFLLYVYTFYSGYNTDWIANTEIGLDPSKRVIKRFRCICFVCIYLILIITPI